jgi:hypothetical protein
MSQSQDSDDTHNWQTMLVIYRKRLAILRQQLASFGFPSAPPHLILDIKETQAQIRHYKTLLQNQGETVDDEPDDERDFFDAPHLRLPPLSATELTIRQGVLRRVFTGSLRDWLQRKHLFPTIITPDLQLMPTALERPWESRAELLSGISIVSVFDAAPDGGLLMLGEPGAGKTTLLLTLTAELHRRASADENAPTPLLVTLPLQPYVEGRNGGSRQAESASEGEIDPESAHRITNIIVRSYRIPLDIADSWLTQGRIILLLDGLDELPLGQRTIFITAINNFIEVYPVPVVVCSRRLDYIAQVTRLRFEGAVHVLPLTLKHIDTALAAGGAPFTAIRDMVQRDSDLAELMRIPLFLTLLVAIFHDTAGVMQSAIPETRALLLERFVDHQLDVKRADVSIPKAELRTWLTWLARGLKAHEQTIITPSLLGPGWLETPNQQRHWARLCNWLIYLSATLGIGLTVTGVVWVFWRSAFIIVVFLIAAFLAYVWVRIDEENTMSHLIFESDQALSEEKPPPDWAGSRLATRAFRNGWKSWLHGCAIPTTLVFVFLFVSYIIVQLIDPLEGSVKALVERLPFYLLGALLIGLIAFFIRVWLAEGGRQVIRRRMLIGMLRRNGALPYTLEKLCAEAAARGLIEPFEDGYRFAHRLLQDHCAKSIDPELEPPPIVGPTPTSEEAKVIEWLHEMEQEVVQALKEPHRDRVELIQLLRLVAENVEQERLPISRSIAQQLLALAMMMENTIE